MWKITTNLEINTFPNKPLIILSAGKDEVQLKCSYNSSVNFFKKRYSRFGKLYGSSENLQIDGPFDSNVTHLGIYSRLMKAYVHIKCVDECLYQVYLL